MNNLTLTQKQQLETMAEAGSKIVTVAYDPTIVVGDPEADALAGGFSEFYREAAADLVEVIYTKAMNPKQQFDFIGAVLSPLIAFSRSGNTATVIDSSGNVASVSADVPRFDCSPTTLACLGLLVEETRTNSVRNNTMQGAVAGAPGTLPTNWSYSGVAGVSRELIGVGSENGIDYLDIRFYGTPSASGGCFLHIETSSGITASPSEAWSHSYYARLVNGSWSNVLTGSNTGFALTPRNSGGLTLAGSSFINYQATSSALIGQRVSASVTTPANTAYVQPWFRFGVTSGSAIDFTLRIGLPQTEKGSGATSVIKTTGAAVTRNADVATITGTDFSDWWQASKGGVLVRARPGTVRGTRPWVQFDDNTADNIIALRGNTTNTELYIVDGGTLQTQIDAGTITANTDYSMTAWWQTNDCKARLNSGAVVADTTATIPTVTQARLGSDGTNYLNGHLASISYYDSFSEQIYTRRKNKAVFNLM